MANLLGTEGWPGVPLWLVEDPSNPFDGELSAFVDRQSGEHIADAPGT
ncbi:hypothetical protein [Pseudomonas sp. DSV-1]|nr:hypothetical protein [Pseudomonas sp. DSV-1]MEC4239361.1 hypothetical protein [Pseudomonas sp. DSV-1]